MHARATRAVEESKAIRAASCASSAVTTSVSASTAERAPFGLRGIGLLPYDVLLMGDVRLDSDEGTARFLALAEALDFAVFIAEPAGPMLWVNSAFVRMTGFTAEDFRFASPDNPFIHPDDVAYIARFLAEFVASDAARSEPVYNRFFDKWGGMQRYRSVVSKVRYEGRPALLYVTSVDGSATPGAEVYEESYRRIVESANDAILKVSRDGRVHFANAQFRELVGLDSVELGKTGLYDVVSAEAREKTRARIAAVADAGERATFESRLAHRTLEPRTVQISASRLTGGADAGLVLALLRDVSEGRRIEEGLRQAQKLESLGSLAGGIAHDFNNIATAIVGNATVADRLAPTGSKLAEVIGDLMDAGRRAATLSRSLLAYLGQTPTRAAPVDLGRLVRDDQRLLRSVIDKRITLRVDPDPEPIIVSGDASQISQVLLNLVVNGAEAADGPDRGEVEVRVGRTQIVQGDSSRWVPTAPPPGRYGVLRVRDSGAGMTDALRSRIFDPFFSTKATGRGLGLSVLLGIVRRHGGAVRIDSKPGAGSSFEVLFPESAMTPAEPESVEIAPPTAEAGARLLFVDDEPSLRKLGKLMLEGAGYEVVLASDAETALACFSPDPASFQAAIVDHTMPGTLGDVLLERLRELQPDLPAIYTSGFMDLAGGKLTSDRTIFLPKPYTEHALQQAVSSALALARTGESR
jgi:PAS domain S-box-containing protein